MRPYRGYPRIDPPQLVAPLKELYENEWNHLVNFFRPSFKLVSKDRKGTPIIKPHDHPKTAWQRIRPSPYIPAEPKQRLQQQFERLNPLALSQQLTRKIKTLSNQVKG